MENNQTQTTGHDWDRECVKCGRKWLEKKEGWNCPVCETQTTGFSPSAVTQEAKHFPLITKPYSARELAARIKSMIETREGVA